MTSTQKCQILAPPPHLPYVNVNRFFHYTPPTNVTTQTVTNFFLDQRP